MMYPQILQRGLQDPDERLDWTRTWDEWLPEGDTIETAEWEVEAEDDDEDPLVILDEAGFEATFDDDSCTVWLSGGTLGRAYLVTCRITTAQGRIKDKSFVIECAVV